MSTTIYRVQDREGRGPWRPGFSDRWVEDRSEQEYQKLKPLLQDFPDGLRRLSKGMHCGCGCSSVDQLRLWFKPGEYFLLLRYGYRAVSLEVDSVVAESDVQCLFQRAAPLWQDAKEINLYAPNSVRLP